MKNLKRFTACLVALIMMITCLPTVVSAKTVDPVLEDATYSDANAAFQDGFDVLVSMITGVTKDSEEELIQALRGTTMQILEVHAGFMEIADDGSDRDFFAKEVPSVFEFKVEQAPVETFGYEAGYKVYRENDYIRIESEAFDPDTKEQFDYLRFEFATREDTGEAMLLFTFYKIDGALTSSNRYLLHNKGKTTQLLYSRTFGKTLEYRIDLNEWAKGTDYKWSKELLYPAL